jgi:hypothetical protein
MTDRPSNTPQPRDREYKGFNLHCEPQYSLWQVETLDGSRTPTVLRHKFTGRKHAEKAVDLYLAGKTKQ